MESGEARNGQHRRGRCESGSTAQRCGPMARDTHGRASPGRGTEGRRGRQARGSDRRHDQQVGERRRYPWAERDLLHARHLRVGEDERERLMRQAEEAGSRDSRRSTWPRPSPTICGWRAWRGDRDVPQQRSPRAAADQRLRPRGTHGLEPHRDAGERRRPRRRARGPPAPTHGERRCSS